MRGPFVLLPPSEGKAHGGRPGRSAAAFDRQLGDARRAVTSALLDALASAGPERAEGLLRVRGELLARALAASEALRDHDVALLPAWRRYEGVVWSALQPHELPAASRRRLLVPSALYGLTTGSDAIADYRLTMHVALPGMGKLSAWWRPRLTELLSARLRGALVVDLLPREHAEAIDFVELGGSCDLLRVDFVTADGARAAGHAAKAVKGAAARAILLEGAGALRGFRWSGWRSRPAGEGFEIVAPRSD